MLGFRSWSLACADGAWLRRRQVGSFFGAWLGGLLYDSTGSYTAMWWVNIGFGVLAALVHLPISNEPFARLEMEPDEKPEKGPQKEDGTSGAEAVELGSKPGQGEGLVPAGDADEGSSGAAERTGAREELVPADASGDGHGAQAQAAGAGDVDPARP